MGLLLSQIILCLHLLHVSSQNVYVTTFFYEIMSKRDKKRKLENATRLRVRSNDYVGLEAIPPTSNMCKRLFSKAGSIWSDVQKSMKPETLETVLFLRVNWDLCDDKMVAKAAYYNKPERLENIVGIDDDSQ